MDVTATVETHTSGSLIIPHMTMTARDVSCPAPIFSKDFEKCGVPGGIDLWTNDGFYSPGQCFHGYVAMCTQSAPVWSLAEGETAVRCIPSDYGCNSPGADPKYAITEYNDLILSAPAFEIRWRSEDVTTSPGNQSTATVSFVKHGRPTTPTTSSQGSETPSSLSTSDPRETTRAESSDITTTSPISSAKPDDAPSLSSIAGIVVGALLGIAAAALVAVYLVYRIRRAKRDTPAEDDSPGRAVDPGAYGYTCQTVDWRQPAELGDIQPGPKELATHPSRRPPSEDVGSSPGGSPRCVSCNRVPIELEGHSASGVNVEGRRT